jgi:DNA-binding transcriptional MerR regulator
MEQEQEAGVGGAWPPIPDKQYFKIGEVSRITEVPPYVLRFWETEFGSLRPEKTRSNQRVYRRRDVELVLRIKRLLYGEGFTIAGARRHLRDGGEDEPEHPGQEAQETERPRGRVVPGGARATQTVFALESRERERERECFRRVLGRVRQELHELLALADEDGP